MTTRREKQKKLYEESRKNRSPVKWDRKSVITMMIAMTVFVCLLAFIGFLATEDIHRFETMPNDQWAATVGRIDDIESMTGIVQTRSGGQVVKRYTIRYSYTVDGITYGKTRHAESLSRWFEKGSEVQVYYRKGKPGKARLNININSDFYRDTRPE